MLSMKGYRISAKIFESSHSLVFRGVRVEDEHPVIIKVLNKEFPTPKEIAEIKREFKITAELGLDGVIQAHGLEKYQNSSGLIVEDFGGESLAKQLLGRKMNLEEFLPVAISTAESLAEIHDQNVIHKDINPGNIVWNPTTSQVKIIDFGIATLLSREALSTKNPNAIEGTLAYISPEQTGRINRALDYRSDLYSLGATFYEMLCGCVPFPFEDALELVHAHIAQSPVDPSHYNLHIPEPVSHLILKLLAKSPEDRYQSAYGVAADLKHFQQQVETKGIIVDGVLGRWDVANRFQIPEKLYGRQDEIHSLMSFFDMACLGQASLVFVSGYSGIGKSALVQEIQKPVSAARGLFIAGKFDQFKRNIPYASLIQAFGELVGQILTLPSEDLDRWRRILKKALGTNGQVIVEVIPEIEHIIGPQPAVPELSPGDGENRFHLVFERFVKTFAKEDHPLVLFLDDLQWADQPSLKLIQRFATDPEQRFMLIIGAYRSNEVNEAHPLWRTMHDLEKAEASLSRIELGPLLLPHIKQLLAETLHQPEDATTPLAQLCLEKTNGNPFFLNQFLQDLYRETCIEFDNEKRVWRWDMAQIERKGGTENVAAFMASHIRKLPAATQHTLKLASCIGNQFDLNTLAYVCETTHQACSESMWEALRAGFVIPLDDNYKIVDEWQEGNAEYRFLHDQVQLAAYAMIGDDQKRATHLHIGRLLLKHSQSQEGDVDLFAIANHLNQGMALIEDPAEKKALADLNLRAGEKARLSAAFAPANRYFQNGLSLMSEDAWREDYALMLALHVEAAETAYLNADFAALDALAEEVIAHGQDLLDRVKIYEIKIFADLNNNKPVEAVKTGFFVLKMLGYSFPKNPGNIHILQSLIKTKLALRGKEIENLANLPEMSDPRVLEAIRIMSSIISATYITKPEWFVLLTFQQLRLAIKHGNPLPAVFTYTAYGVMLCAFLGDIDKGYRFGIMAQGMLSKLHPHEYKAKSIYSFHTFIWHWKQDVKQGLRPFLDAYQAGLETGDLEFAGWSVFVYIAYSFLSGRELHQLEEQTKPYRQALDGFQHEMAVRYAAICHQTTLNMMGAAHDPCLLQGESYDEQAEAAFHERGEDQLANFLLYFHKLLLCYLFGKYPEAVAHADKAETFMPSAAGKYLIPFFHFLDSLARLALLKQQPEHRKKFLSKISGHLKKLRLWASKSEVNHQHKVDLVEAELAAYQGKQHQALHAYEKAMNHARNHDFLFEEALAFELSARFHFAKKQVQIAQFYLRNAQNAYQRWGAKAKVDDLKKRYLEVFSERWQSRINEGGALHMRTHTSGETVSEVLDLATVMKAAETLSSEIVLDHLVEKLMGIALENAGAQRGLLVASTDVGWRIEAQKAIQGASEFEIGDRVFGNQNPEEIPLGMIQYVKRTKKPMVLQNARHEDTFIGDSYVLAQRPKSMLCLPLEKQGELIAILYLENNLTTNAFPPERLNILKMLSSQAAISLENAQLYTSLEAHSEILEQTVGERTRELRHKNEQLISSIRYAQRIQNATLLGTEDMREMFPKSLVIYRPRDIVSGDFYWISKNANCIMVAVVDCTGHGVPGALLSMLGHSLLNQIINQQGVSEPAAIIELLDERVRDALRQEQGADSTDGMELCLCRIERDTQRLLFTGSRRPLYMVRDGKFLEVKGDRRGVGGRHRRKVTRFSQTEVAYKPGDRVYLSSDGFADQASPAGKKFGSRRLKLLLNELMGLSLAEQEEAMVRALKQHQAGHVQVDDITLIGLEL